MMSLNQIEKERKETKTEDKHKLDKLFLLEQLAHTCTIQLKHAHGYQCPECYKITK
jgi:hypothetical protein